MCRAFSAPERSISPRATRTYTQDSYLGGKNDVTNQESRAS
jgi:hypothetical protein